jgi:F0F1-type ATP synthase assembly protein I
VTQEKGDPPQPAENPDFGSDSGVSGTSAEKPGIGQGEDVAWSALSSLLAGLLLWLGIGWAADKLFGTGRIFTSIGVFVGFGLGMYIVYVRFGRDPKSPPDDRSRN